jgi:glutaredoxin
MEGCIHCNDFKNFLKEDKIEFFDMDINKHPEEYQMFTQITENDYVPAFMIVDDQTNVAEYFAPDRDFNELDEGIKIIKEKI